MPAPREKRLAVENNQASQNTDREIWRGKSRAEFGDDDRYYADSLFVPQSDVEALGINCGGFVIVKPIREWHALAQQKGEKMPTFPYTDSAKPLPGPIELREAAAAHGYRLVPIDQPAASEERGLRLLREHNYAYQEPFEDMKAGFYYCLCGWQGPDRLSYWKHLEALQSVPRSLPQDALSELEDK